MKVLLLLTTVISFCLANEIFDVKNLKIENLKLDLDPKLKEKILNKNYEARAESEIIAVVNEYADLVFKNIEDLAIEDHLDPLNLTDVEADYLASSINLTNGHLNGVATINRSEDVIISYSSDTKVLELYVPIMFSNLNVTYDYHVIILLIGPKGSMTVKIEEFKMNLRIQFNLETLHAAVTEVTTSNKGHISLIFQGNGIVDEVVNVLTEFTNIILQPLIGGIIEDTVSNVADMIVQVINDAIDSIFYPDLLTTTVDSSTVIF